VFKRLKGTEKKGRDMTSWEKKYAVANFLKNLKPTSHTISKIRYVQKSPIFNVLKSSNKNTVTIDAVSILP
jgi:hypothetical protein